MPGPPVKVFADFRTHELTGMGITGGMMCGNILTMKTYVAIFLMQAVLVTCPALASDVPTRSIDVWHGHQQRFGNLGEPQRWINVLGRVHNSTGVKSVEMILNEGAAKTLTLGSDTHRLADEGDFNAELPWNVLRSGKNELEITATWSDGTTAIETVELEVVRDRKWPLPYHVDFTKVKKLQDVVQIVDGKWKLTSAGVRTERPYYDRVLSFGDRTWKDYEATIRLTVHGFTPPKPGPPTYDVTHVGVALRWQGHTSDKRQPSRRWYPLGAQGEFLIRPNLSRSRWRILPSEKERTYAKSTTGIELDKPVSIKAQVVTTPSDDSRYRFKLWSAEEPEPLGWSVEHIEDGKEDLSSGSVCLVPHNTDVTYHEVRVVPLTSSEDEDAARPSTTPPHNRPDPGRH